MDDRNFVTRLLKQSILTLCREAVTYSSQLEVDGIVSVTIDGRDVHIVKIHELFLKHGQTNHDTDGAAAQSRYTNTNIRQISQSAAVHYGSNSVKSEPVETNNNAQEEEKRPNIVKDRTIENGGDHGVEMKPPIQNRESPSTSSETIEAQLQKLPISKDKDIPCKRCAEILPDVDAYDAHCLKVHSQYACRVCLSTFTSRNNMKRHVRIHTGIKPYTCAHCKESFSRNDDYKRHLLRHTFNKPFRCSVCYIGYADKPSLRTHMIKEHNAYVFHTCSQCGETFLDSILYEKHKKVHRGLNSYNCTICSFNGSNALIYNKHMLTHGPPKQYRCNHCEKTFSDPFTYTNHLTLHQDDELVQCYACCFCDLRLQTYEQFQNHELSHVNTQVRLHGCNVCYKQFMNPSNLKEHLMTHISSGSKTAVKKQEESNETTINPENAEINLDVEMNIDEARDQALNELNNNTTTDDANVAMERKESGYVHSNDYWCTECNQGFETEERLQEHIVNTHEKGPMENDANNNENGSDPAFVYKTPSPNSLRTSPYEIETQVDEENNDPYEENTQVDCPTTVFDDDTVMDNVDQYSKDLTTGLRNKANIHLSPAEVAITANAIKQVMDLQRQFNLKPPSGTPSTRNPPWDRPLQVSAGGQPLFPSSVGLGRFLTSDRRPYGPSRNPLNLSKKEPDTLTSFKSRTHQRKANIPRHIDDNAVEWDEPVNNSVFNSTSSLSSMLTSSPSSIRDVKSSTESYELTKTSSPTTLNLKVRNPGFEKVITPEILFKTKAPFTCEVCEETFLDFESFDRHGITVHRRFICSYCGKVFTSRPNRERHVRYHTGDKPYKCDICSMAFFRGDDLKYHRTTRHPDIKPYVCTVCTSQFTQAKELDKHLRMYPDHKTAIVN